MFFQTSEFEFVWDDERTHLTANRDLMEGNLGRFWRQPYEGLYIPLSYTAWYGISRIAHSHSKAEGLNPRSFHLANITLHALNCLLVFTILFVLFQNSIGALVGAMLFALHPVQVESVAWVSEFRGLLNGFFFLSAFLAFLKWRVVAGACAFWIDSNQSLPHLRLNRKANQPPERNARTYIWIITMSICYIAAVMCKPAALVFPVFVLAFDWLVFNMPKKKMYLTALSLAVVAVPFVLLTTSSQPANLVVEATPFWARPLLVGDAVCFYFSKLVLPINLSPSYGRTPEVLMQSDLFFFLWIVPVMVFTWLVFNLKKWKWQLLLFTIFIAGFLPVSGWVSFYFQQFSNVADRYLYLAIFALSLAFCKWISFSQHKSLLTGLSALVVFVFGILSIQQTQAWKTDLSLWTKVIETSPGQALAHTNRGIIYHEKGDFQKALHDYNMAVDLDPGLAKAYGNRGNTHAFMRNLDKAMKDFTKAIELNPEYERAYGNRAVGWFQLQQYENAKRDLEVAMELGYEPHPQFVKDLEGKLYR